MLESVEECAFQTWGQPSDCFYLCNRSPDIEGWQPPGSAPAPGISKGWETALPERGWGQTKGQSAIAFTPHLGLCSAAYQYAGQMIELVSAANKQSKIRTNIHILLLILLCSDWELFLEALPSCSWDSPAKDTKMQSNVHEYSRI